METLEDKIKKAITNKAFDRCSGCRDEAVKEIKAAMKEYIKEQLDKAIEELEDLRECGTGMVIPEGGSECFTTFSKVLNKMIDMKIRIIRHAYAKGQ